MIKTDDINELHVNRKFAQGLLRQKISFEFDNFSFNFPNILVIFTSYLFNPLSIFVFFSLQFGFFLLEKERKNERLIQTLASQQKIAFGKALFSLERVIADLTVAFFLAIIVFVLSNKTLLSHGVGSFIYPISFFWTHVAYLAMAVSLGLVWFDQFFVANFYICFALPENNQSTRSERI